MATSTRQHRTGRWIDAWEPEDASFWQRTGRRVALRNLIFSVLVEHVGFSVWSLWSVLVLFLGDDYSLDVGQKFLLVTLPNLVGSVLRVPYTFAVAWFGGRNWTVISAALLLVPTIAAAFVLRPGVSFGTLLIIAALAGFGGGNFASSMTNVNAFFPQSAKGRALGVNAGGGNVGVAVIQIVGLVVIGTAGASHPTLMLAVYIPLVVVVAVAAALAMNNLSAMANDTGAAVEALRQPHLWLMSVLYIGTFGSFIGYSFAFGLVLQNQFARTPLQAAELTFLGPLIGSLIRPVGGWLADRTGGAKITVWVFVGLAACSAVCIAASSTGSLALYVVGFLALFGLSGVGNGSTYRMIPTIFRRKADAEFGAGTAEAANWTRRISGAVIGLVSAIGALGGIGINLAFRQSFGSLATGTPAFVGFLAFYAVCCGLTYVVYLRPAGTADPALAYQQV